jgi:hypothetical protein
MPDFDWRAPKAYANIHTADRAELAWECLRRDTEYHDHYDAVTNPNVSAPSAFRRRWRLIFRS